MKKNFGLFGLILVTIIWGSAFVVSDIALKSATPFQILTARFFIASLAMAFFARKQVKNINKKDVTCGVFLGIALFLAFAFQTIGLQYTTPSKNAFLTATNVVFVPFIALAIVKKKIATKNLIGAIIAIIGAGVLSLQSDFSINFGDALTLVCAVGFAFQIFLTGEYVTKVSPFILNLIQMATAFVLSFLCMIMFDELNFVITTEGVLSILYLGIMSTTICYLLQTISQKYVDETKAAIILSMEAVFGTIFSVIILSEPITTKMIVGSILILSAVLISEVNIKKERVQK